MYTDFLSACRQQQREKRLLSIQRLLSIMECYPDHPEYRAHRATLRYLATHLARVSAREIVNKMTAYNLALVFAPNLVQPYEDSPELLMSDSKYKIRVSFLRSSVLVWGLIITDSFLARLRSYVGGKNPLKATHRLHERL